MKPSSGSDFKRQSLMSALSHPGTDPTQVLKPQYNPWLSLNDSSLRHEFSQTQTEIEEPVKSSVKWLVWLRLLFGAKPKVSR